MLVLYFCSATALFLVPTATALMLHCLLSKRKNALAPSGSTFLALAQFLFLSMGEGEESFCITVCCIFKRQRKAFSTAQQSRFARISFLKTIVDWTRLL